LGAKVKVGFNPVSQSEMYLFLTEYRPTNDFVPEEALVPQLAQLLGAFSAPMVAESRRNLGAHSHVVYRPLEAMLMPQPWYRGRVLLVGDAAHATTPHLAAGAGMGIEDAIVLAEELRAGDSLPEALQRFQQRRWERCRMVVENSLRLGEIEATGGSQEEHAQLMRDSMMALAAPF
ncbi:MAG TPA: FAD-dependent monooxygenase, partial [Steroidobacteraceae bacterium]|nr:FAD-dependent monooxygenase [Steroidobacteraceae bacterium]